MITIHRFIDAYRSYHEGRHDFRLLQDQALILISSCRNTYRPITYAFDVTGADLDWLLQQSETTQDYADLFGGDVYICEREADLTQIVGMDMDWANSHDGQWPSVIDVPLAWDIRYVSPARRHDGEDHAILAPRRALYATAREVNPARWSGTTRNWSPARIENIRLGRTGATLPSRKTIE